MPNVISMNSGGIGQLHTITIHGLVNNFANSYIKLNPNANASALEKSCRLF